MKKILLSIIITVATQVVVAQNYYISIEKGIVIPKTGSLTENDTVYFSKIKAPYLYNYITAVQVEYVYLGRDTTTVIWGNNFKLEGAEVNALYDAIFSSIPNGLTYLEEQSYIYHAGMRLKIYEYFNRKGITLNDIVIKSN